MSRGICAPRNNAKDEARHRIVSFYCSESLCECGVLLVKVTRAQCHARSFGLEWRLHVLAIGVWHKDWNAYASDLGLAECAFVVNEFLKSSVQVGRSALILNENLHFVNIFYLLIQARSVLG